MRKIYLLGLVLFISLFATAQDLVITEVFDGPLPGGLPKAVEVYVINDITDLSTFGIGSANNAGGTDGVELQLNGSATAGDFIYIASEALEFQNFFGFAPNFIDSVVNVNGDDSIELFDNVTDDGSGNLSGDVIDVFGVVGIDGNGEPWEYLDGWAYRISGTGPDGATFQLASWTFSGVDANDGDITQDTATNPWPLGTYTMEAPTPIFNFEENVFQVNENEGSVSLDITISVTADATVDVVVLTTNDLTAAFDTTTATATFTAGGTTTQTVTFNFADNNDPNQDYYIGLELTNTNGGDLGETSLATVYVIDDELHAPVAVNALNMTLLTSYDGVAEAEIVAFDAGVQRLFVSNSSDNGVEIVDFSNPANPSSVDLISMAAFGEEVTSVAAFDGIVAVAVAGADQANGRIVLIDTDGNLLADVMAGALPDMVTFTPNGSKVLFANEGEPSEDYTNDPEGSIGIIDLSAGALTITQDDVTILDFNAFDTQIDDLREAGVRVFGPGASVSQDLEPEFITVSDDGTQAFVSLQENNAVAIVDLENMVINAVESLGTKDMSLEENATDISNELPFIFLSTWNVQMMRQPDAIANYTIDGVTYIITANEGDGREYDAFEEVERGNDFDLDPTAFPNAAFLQKDNNLGRLEITNTLGDTDGDGDFDELFAFGARSFSIFNIDTGELVYDSADLLERITAEDPVFGAIFNTTDDENEFKNRSDDGGPEPEGVIVSEIGDRFYAFIGLERIGGIVVFDVTDPSAPTFETYVNNRATVPGDNPAGDLAPEGLIYIAPEDNATETGLIVVANEVSATISVYQLNNDNLLSTDDFSLDDNTIIAYPNPVDEGQLFFSKATAFKMYDIAGRLLKDGDITTTADVSNLKSGVYLVRFDNGTSQKVIIR